MAADGGGLEPGRMVMVEYFDEPKLWMERILLREASPAVMLAVTGAAVENGGPLWWVLTPDGLVYPEELAVGPLRGLIALDEEGQPILASAAPPTARPRKIHGFGRGGSLTLASPLLFSRAQKEADAAALAWGSRRRLRGKQSGAPPLPLAAAPEEIFGLRIFVGGGPPQAHPQRRAGGRSWTITRCEVPSLIGRPPPPGVKEYALVGTYALAVAMDDTVMVAEMLSTKEADALAGGVPRTRSPDSTPRGVGAAEVDDSGKDLDARVLPIGRIADGRRYRGFKESVAALLQSDWEGWPIKGPRTFIFCVRFIAEVDGHPMAHHTRFKSIANVQHHDAGVASHETAMRIFEYALCYDQLQGAELACLEIVARSAQLVELKYRDKVLVTQTGSTGATMLDQDDYIYLGYGKTRGQLMIDPALEEHVGSELQKESSAAKERRKMLEERNLSRPPQPTGGKDGGGKGKPPADKK